jgi:hypothetical protein
MCKNRCIFTHFSGNRPLHRIYANRGIFLRVIKRSCTLLGSKIQGVWRDSTVKMKGRPVLRIGLTSESGIFPSEKTCVSVGATLPDPLFMQFFQEFLIEQGVGGSQSGINLGFVCTVRPVPRYARWERNPGNSPDMRVLSAGSYGRFPGFTGIHPEEMRVSFRYHPSFVIRSTFTIARLAPASGGSRCESVCSAVQRRLIPRELVWNQPSLSFRKDCSTFPSLFRNFMMHSSFLMDSPRKKKDNRFFAIPAGLTLITEVSSPHQRRL